MTIALPPAGQTPGLTDAGLTLGTIALTLGSFQFYQFEVPEQIDHVGIVGKYAVHDFPGGYRTVQSMGVFPATIIKWSGQFMAQDIPGQDMYVNRINTLQQMAIQQSGNTLTVGNFSFSPVFIRALELKMRLGWWIPYDIELIAVANLNAGLPAPSPTPTPGGQVAQLNQESIDYLNSLG